MSSCFALLDLPGGDLLLFEELRATLAIDAAGDVAAVCAEAQRQADAGGFVVAALDYELGHLFEPSAGPVAAGIVGRFWVFARQRRLDAASFAAFLAARGVPAATPAILAAFRPLLSADGHAQAVRRIRDYIAAGDCYQVNFTFPFVARCIGDPLALYARLRLAQPVAHGGMVSTSEGCIVSCSPELFVSREAGVLRSRPMKGTAPRHADPLLDGASAQALRASIKDRAENVMIVDLIRSDLGRIAEPGSVRVGELCAVEAYPSVYQMTSDVEARSRAPFAEVLAALFPCGSITGAPKVRAMQIIRELEAGPRGLYTGAFGWLGAGGDFRLSVAIRTLTIDPAGDARYCVGSGIVWDSVPADEYRECLLKAAFLTRGDPGFRLIETLRLENGVFPFLELHLDRLATSATCLGFVCDRLAVARALGECAAGRPEGVFRVRLTLGHDGGSEWTAVPFDALTGPLAAVLSPRRLASDDFWLAHKTTVRASYDAELQRVASRSGVFDAIFLNERGEVCEGARSNVFLRRRAGEKLLTPPLSSGLLPGVLRRRLLETGEAAEVVLREEDLRGAAEIYLGNALRGLLRVSLNF